MGVRVRREGAALPLRSSLPTVVVRYDSGGSLYNYDEKYYDVDGGERCGGGGGGEVGYYGYYEKEGREDALGEGVGEGG